MRECARCGDPATERYCSYNCMEASAFADARTRQRIIDGVTL